jgi:hypothetical protein
VEGRTQGDDVQIVLGIGINKKPTPVLDHSMGWESLFNLEFEDLFPVIHASVASLLENHPLLADCGHADVLNSVYATMRFTISEGKPLAFGLDETGGLRTPNGVVDSTGEIQWNWI